ncbi:MAG: hypothetical protein ABIG28_02435 [archaeon]
MKRGQAWGFDLIVAVVIFLAGMMLFFLYALNFSSERDEVFDVLSYEGKIIGDSLLSEGFPVDWDSGNVVTIGILSDGKVNDTKLLEFYNLAEGDYNRTKKMFNVLNDYYVFFEEPIVVEGTTIDGVGVQESDQKNLVRVSRVAVQGNKIKNLNIYVWS